MVLGYIYNTNRRFFVYVANRVTRIRKSTQPEQWHFVSTDQNPADCATRPVPASLLGQTNWFSGPLWLKKGDKTTTNQSESFKLIELDTDADVRPLVSTFATKASAAQLGSHRFSRFSSWKLLTHGMTKLIQKCRSCARAPENVIRKTEESMQAKNVIVKTVQQEIFHKEIQSLSKGEIVSKLSPLRKLDPILDQMAY